MKLRLARCEGVAWFRLEEKQQIEVCKTCPNMYDGTCLREAREVSATMDSPTIWEMPGVIGGLTRKERQKLD